LQNVNIRKLIF